MDKKEFEFEISEEIKHLSSEEIEEVYTRYMAGEKNAALVDEYRINIPPNRLIAVLPPEILYERPCVYCYKPMLKRRRSKSASAYSAPPTECYNCGHKVYQEGRGRNNKTCDCEACVNFFKEREVKKQEEKRYRVAEQYDVSNFSVVDYADLGFSHKLVLLTLLRMQTGEGFEFIQPLESLSKSECFTPTHKMNVQCLRELYRFNALLVDPDSSIDAFVEEGEGYAFYINSVQWIPNVTLNGKERAKGGELYNAIYQELKLGVQYPYETELHDLLYEIAQEEVLQYVAFQAGELSVSFVAEDKTREIVKQLLHYFSVSEIYYFAKKSVENAHLYYTKGLAKSKKHAANTIPNKMLSLGERSLVEKWDTYKYNRISRVPRSHISIIMYDFFLQDEDAGFTNAPCLYWEKELRRKYFSPDDEYTGGKLYCIQCGSDVVTVKPVDKGLEQACQACGDVTYYVHAE